MIDISKLTNRDVGREVICLWHSHNKICKLNGKIVSWDMDRKFIYVRFPSNYIYDGYIDSNFETDNEKRGLSVHTEELNFKVSPKPVEIITRADLMDLDDD